MHRQYDELLTESGKEAIGHWFDRDTHPLAKEALNEWGTLAGEAFFRQSMRATATILARHGATNVNSDAFREATGLIFGIVNGSVDLATGVLGIEGGADGIRQWIGSSDLDARASAVARLVAEEMARGRTDFMEG